MDKDQNTEQKVIDAARKVFLKKGYTGARMQEIADEAGINKALLHYYFRSKDKLFDEIFNQAFDRFIPGLLQIFQTEMELEKAIRSFVDNYIEFISNNRFLPSFILNEINQNPQRIAGKIPVQDIRETKFYKKILSEAEAGRIRYVNPVELFINMLSLSLFPFAASPLLKLVFDMDEVEFDEFIERRKKTIPDMIMSYLKND